MKDLYSKKYKMLMKKKKTENGKTSWVRGLEGLILFRSPYYPK